MGICLNMIVKNEENNLERLFASIYKYIDYFIISDTGSTDNTIEILNALGKLYNISGKVVKHEWKNFGYNRQCALDVAVQAKLNGEHNCNWLMLIDADEELFVLEKSWKIKLNEGVSYTTYKKLNGFTFKNLFLVWIDNQLWNWKGNIHEYLKNGNINHPHIHTNAVYILSHQSEGSNSSGFANSKEKSLYYLEQLKDELGSDEINSDNAFRFFQLVLTYGDLQEFYSAVHLLEQIVLCKGISGDLYYMSLVYLAKYRMMIYQNFANVPEILDEAIELFKNRKEAYYYLATYFRNSGNLLKAKMILEEANNLPISIPESIIVEEELYNWKISFDLAFIYFGLKELDNALRLVDNLLENIYVPDIEMSFLFGLKRKIETSFSL